jgi:hypothetical protein
MSKENNQKSLDLEYPYPLYENSYKILNSYDLCEIKDRQEAPIIWNMPSKKEDFLYVLLFIKLTPSE